jgi:hypothetical protein
MNLSLPEEGDAREWVRMPNEKDREFYRRVFSGHLTPQLSMFRIFVLDGK